MPWPVSQSKPSPPAPRRGGVVTSTDEKNSRSPILTIPCGWCAGNAIGMARSRVHEDARVNAAMRSAIDGVGQRQEWRRGEQ